MAVVSRTIYIMLSLISGKAFWGNWGADGTSILCGLIMAIEEVNARGGLLGRPLEYVAADTVDWTAEYRIAARDYLMGIPEAFNRANF